MPVLKIRSATASDMPAMIAIVNAAFSIEPFVEGTRTDHERLSEMMKKGQFLVGEDGSGRVVASVYTELRGERGYFGMLAVDPALQKSGYGRQMIAAAEEFLRSHGCKFVDIAVVNLRAELPPFYRRLGYVETGTEEFRPSRPMKPGYSAHVIIMSKTLHP